MKTKKAGCNDYIIGAKTAGKKSYIQSSQYGVAIPDWHEKNYQGIKESVKKELHINSFVENI